MNPDDIVYITLLIFTIIFGPFYRRISDVNLKKWVSTTLGFSIVFFVSGIHVLHLLIVTAVNAFFILHTSKKTCHKASFGFTFLYLLFFRTTEYFGIPYAPSHTNLIQMLFTLKLVGMAFEVHDSFKLAEIEAALDPPITTKRNYIRPDLMEIIHYSFCYVGVLTGPYYSYKTYRDHLITSFGDWAPCYSATLNKLRPIPLCAAVFLLMTNYFPLKTMESEEFYTETSFIYRFFYLFPIFTTFRMRLFIAFLLSECACTMAGIGAYPVCTKPRPGMGPSTEIELVEALSADKELAKTYDYEFSTVRNLDVYMCEVSAFRQSIKSWNMCIQYWLAHIVYKRFPIKAMRTGVVFIVSAYWHGMYLGHYCTLIPPPFVLLLEDTYEKLFNKKEATGMKKFILDNVFWMFSCHAFSYLGVAFSLLTMERCIKYYSSIYYFYHVVFGVALVVGLILRQILPRPKKEKEPIKKE